MIIGYWGAAGDGAGMVPDIPSPALAVLGENTTYIGYFFQVLSSGCGDVP